MRWLLALSTACIVLTGPAQAAVSVVVASGLGGTPEYAEAFASHAKDVGAGFATLTNDDAAVLVLEAPEREALLEAIERQRSVAGAGLFALVLIGHGNVDGRSWHFNLPGPDLDTEDLVAALAFGSVANELVVIATSSSGAVLETLAQPGRVVVTATKSGSEQNAVRFPEYFAEAMRSEAADIDRNEILTLGEAYRYADAEVRRWYEREKLLASEHARIEGEGAASLGIARLGALAKAADDPVVAALLAERLVLERDFETLKRSKPELSRERYYDDLEALLLKIARLQLSIDAATGWRESDAES